MTRPAAEKTGPELHWSGRVLTWDDLRAHLETLRELVVADKTIVSPLVVDELKARNIVLRRGTADASFQNRSEGQKGGTGGIGYALDQPSAMVDSVAAALTREGLALDLWRPLGDSLAAWAWSLGLLVKEKSKRGVALVSDAALVACVAGKVPGVRAAQVAGVPQAKRSLTTLGANLLALELPGPTYFEVKQVLRAAATTAAMSPPEIEQVLKELDGHAHR